MTKNLNLENLGVLELNANEMKEQNGGLWIELAGLALAVVAFCYSVGKDAAESDRRNAK
ncbi:hypothetical protein SAMN04515674_106149 [Pseudarcicella hirudinis]|uniref:Class IIb bacteriocin, lactobin A/cerein 7B family n=2 Tax=Pseudarcicella hirudinis TaxID=1079859 RepID=A0A1I5TQ51_9BACT|nr:hypothetical protein [Pseudarcicella hirudinis]SFP85165.1 hypothetical protein SAMN04515674_106149 [Pseudarcicella hirudinis]